MTTLLLTAMIVSQPPCPCGDACPCPQAPTVAVNYAPPTLPQAPPLEQRMTAMEWEIAALKARQAVLEAKVMPNNSYVPKPMPTQTPPAVKGSFSGVVPPGYHAHRDAAGNVIVHHNSNNGVPGAHAGMNPVRIAEGGQTVPGSFFGPSPTTMTNYRGAFADDGCPAGGCPAQKTSSQTTQRKGLFGFRR